MALRYVAANLAQRTQQKGVGAVRAISQAPVMFSDVGSGAGKGGGSGGSIREAGGSFGRMEAVREEEYIRRKERLQKERMMANKANLSDMNAKESAKKEDVIFVEPKAQQDNTFVDEGAIQNTKKKIEELQKNAFFEEYMEISPQREEMMSQISILNQMLQPGKIGHAEGPR